MKIWERVTNKKNKFMFAVVLAASVILAGYPAFARYDEMLLENAPYVSPPVVTGLAALDLPDLYEVRHGDTLTAIAGKSGLPIETLAMVNGLPDRDKIQAGQVLKIPSDDTRHCVQPGETLWEIARMCQVDVNAIASRNRLADANKIIPGQQIYIPGGLRDNNLPTTSRGPAPKLLAWPLVGEITSPFGIRDGRPHEGLDIAADEGAPIRAVASGTVIFAGLRGTYGLAVIIDHGDGMRTLYAHCSKILVSEDSHVDAATIIALAGNTGASRGPHLHLEVQKDGKAIDPLPCLKRGSFYG